MPLSIDVADAEGRYELALAHSETPERLYDRQWCLTLLDRVFEISLGRQRRRRRLLRED